MSASNRDNTSVLIRASAASTAFTGPWIKNEGTLGGIFMFDVTATETTAALTTFTVQGRVGDSTKAYNIAAITATSTRSVNVLVVYPGASTAGSEFPTGASQSTGDRAIVSLPLPYQFRVRGLSATTGTATWQGWVDLLS